MFSFSVYHLLLVLYAFIRHFHSHFSFLIARRLIFYLPFSACICLLPRCLLFVHFLLFSYHLLVSSIRFLGDAFLHSLSYHSNRSLMYFIHFWHLGNLRLARLQKVACINHLELQYGLQFCPRIDHICAITFHYLISEIFLNSLV